MAKTGSSPDVFLSYSSRDGEWATRISAYLVAEGFRVWGDRDLIQPGESLQSCIKTGIRQAQVVVVLLSPAFLASQWAQVEVDSAAAQGIPVIPVLIEDCQPEGFLARLNWADARSGAPEALKRVAASIRYLSGEGRP